MSPYIALLCLAVVLALSHAAQCAELPGYHVVYVQYFDPAVRNLNNGNALSISAPTMQEELESLIGVYKGGHEIVAALTAGATKHTKMYTNLPDSKIEVDTFIFVFTPADALLLPHMRLFAPAAEPGDEFADAPELARLGSTPAERRRSPTPVLDNVPATE